MLAVCTKFTELQYPLEVSVAPWFAWSSGRPRIRWPSLDKGHVLADRGISFVILRLGILELKEVRIWSLALM
jgi:hypothetical protein